MDERKKLILDIIIREHIASGQPVASSSIVEKYKLPFSPATVRNEMAELEDGGWIVQPHTSAGRVPTEKAYKHYISHLTESPLPRKETEMLKAAVTANEAKARQLAKQLAQLTGLAVVWALEKDNVYYTGVGNLLQERDFDLAAIIDDMDEIVADIFENIEFSPQVLVGHSSPFGDTSATIVSRYRVNDTTGLIGLVGPMHMDYAANRLRIKFLTELLSNDV